MKKIHYNVRWDGTHANVSFQSISDHHAKLMADKIGRELRRNAATRTLTRRDQPGVLIK
jgi:hypothetical protein